MTSSKKARSWKQDLDASIQRILVALRKIFAFGIDVQLVMISTNSLDIRSSIFVMNFMNEESLYARVVLFT